MGGIFLLVTLAPHAGRTQWEPVLICDNRGIGLIFCIFYFFETRVTVDLELIFLTGFYSCPELPLHPQGSQE